MLYSVDGFRECGQERPTDELVEEQEVLITP